MKWHQVLSIGLSLLLILAQMTQNASACSGMERKYSYLLDLVFPTEPEACSLPGFHALFSSEKMIIRILPGLSQESQILVCRGEGGQTFVVHSTLTPKSHSVWSHLFVIKKLSENSDEAIPSEESAEVIATRIEAEHKTCRLDSRSVAKWFSELGKVRMDLPKGGGGNDGVIYDVTIEHGMDSMNARIWVADEQKPLITLVDGISKEIEHANCETLQKTAKHS